MSKMTSNGDLLTKKGTAEVWNQFVIDISSKGIKRIHLSTEKLLVTLINF